MKIKTVSNRHIVSTICALLLFIAVLHLPAGYYRFLRVVVFIGALLVVYRNRKDWLFWTILFVCVAILFNPIQPIYLYKRSIWMPLDIIVGILFLIEGFLKKEKQEENEIEEERESKQEEKTFGRDRIL